MLTNTIYFFQDAMWNICLLKKVMQLYGRKIQLDYWEFLLIQIYHSTNMLRQFVKSLTRLTVLLRTVYILPGEQRKVLVNTYFDSQLYYCPLLWIFCSRSLNIKINILHKSPLRIVYNDYTTAFEDFSAKAKTVIIHQQNIADHPTS